ncbi:2OG-Fe(II) oxygenase [Albimonas sp. CAU 1670]|uniref:2OG-Fe(II) oxygenase n=1 Tax=Albimonas sp. CAU 1670 TaxID=3032599 RepID=UPI0023DC7752|nr:2OG-Fe(II) oxygenase [Albimonas sp. CAU 1670]MDF2232301.1 2OG-Fe(II) oxygenase [Albimonas sp. CAU 1670]
MLHPHPLPALFSPEDCARIIELAEAASLAEARLVGGRRQSEIRRARIAWIDDAPDTEWISARLARAFAEANRAAFDFEIEAFEERAQVALYDGSEQGGFDWHSDVGDGPLARRRKLTVVVQLSEPDDYEGGELEINGDGRPRTAGRARGDAIAFPAFALHRVAPVTRGRRWSLTLWAHGPSFR